MTFTYSSTDLSTDLAKVRLEIGDTNSSAALFTDEEINAKLVTARGGNVMLAAADLCDVLATRYAIQADTDLGDQRIALGQISAAFRARAKDLRARASGGTGIVSVDTTRVDGYSSTIASQDVGAANSSRFDSVYGDV